MNFFQIFILGLVQGAAELLPVSSSAHVIIAEKLMGLDPSSPEMTFLLVMLHTGTMFAVIVYFWNSWLDHYCSDAKQLESAFKTVVTATVVTVVVGFILQWIIVKVFLHGVPKAEIEDIFSNLPLIGSALLAAGVLIIFSGTLEERRPGVRALDVASASIVGAVQGLCLPFRGFSRSGGTISAGLLLGIRRRQIEEFSFALAVVLTPLVVGRELWRLIKAHPEVTHGSELIKLLTPGFLGMACSFVAGYLALKLLSSLLETGRWKFFGYYCLVASAAVFILFHTGTRSAAATITDGTSQPSVVVPSPETPSTTNAIVPMPITNAETTPVAPAVAPDDTNAVITPAVPATNEPVTPRALPVNPADLTNGTIAPVPPSTGANGTVLTPGSIHQPVFNVRHVVSQLTISEAGTTVTGSLIREDTTSHPTSSAPANVPPH